jgi:D-alanine-D-alanine ligase
MSLLEVAVIGGGRSPEHDVSLASAAAVAAALDRTRYRVHEFTIEPDGAWSRAGATVDAANAIAGIAACAVAIPMLHGPNGEDGTIAGLLELLGVPFTGSGVRAGAIAMDKWATKLVAAAVGIPTAAGRLVTAADPHPVAWTLPVVVKPVASGSSRGVTLVREPDALPGAIAEALEFDDRVLVEQFVVGREVDVAVLCGPDGATVPAPMLEIVRDDIFGFDEKYGGAARFLVPAPIPDEDTRMLRAHATRIAEALGCRGVIRADFFLTEAGPVLNEVNTTPGFTEHSQVPRMFAAADVSYPELLDLLLDTALFGTLGDRRPTMEVRT